jgi:3',5'-nucleoside bisphosphate phosphatase
LTETIRIDLHCHSSASDGDHSPAHVARRLADIGVTWASLTDHNTVGGQTEFRAAVARYGIGWVPGVEIDARSAFGPLHLLAYAIDLDNEHLLAVLRAIREPWRSSARQWLERIRSVRQESSPPATPCVAGAPDDRHLGPLTTRRAICLIHEAGGLAFLAHPLESLRSFKRLEEALDILTQEGLDGLEVFHRSYPEGVRAALLSLALRRGLLRTGGSDFHGLDHSDGATLGVDVPAEEWGHMIEYLRIGSGLAPFAAPGINSTT